MRPLFAVVVFALTGAAQATHLETIFASSFEDGEQPPRATKPVGLGTNLESVVDFAAAYPFADFFKQSRPWITASQSVFDTEDAAQLDLDGDGWVRSLPACSADPQQFCIARTVLFSNPATVYPAGNYTVRYDGQGTLAYRQNSLPLTPISTPGQDILALSGSQILQLDILATAAPPNHLRNIRIYPPGIDADNPPLFHPDFLARLQPYRTLRFMDWMHANGGGFGGAPNPQVAFSDRALPSDAHWSRDAGVPLEVMLDLANQSGTEPWFTLPHQVNDDYVTRFARLVRERLAPGRLLYVEHSNEVWNNFPQGNAVQERGTQLLGNVATPFERRLNAHGLRTRQICDLFRAEFGSESDRIVCSLGAQAANAFTASEAADCPLARQAGLIATPCLGTGDALAIAPYFANYTNVPANADEIAGWNLDQLFRELTTGGELAQNESTPCTDNAVFAGRVVAGRCTVPALEEIEAWLSANREVTQARGMRLIAYEGGQHLVGVFGVENNPTITNLFVAANRDARMEAIYRDYLARWKALGGELFVNFALSFPYGPSGSWGVLESLTQTPDPPKVRAIDAFNAANPCWWQGCGVEQPDTEPPSCPQPVVDGGFEATTSSNTNPNWASTSSQFGSALCDTGIALCANDPNAPGSVGPRGGTAWTWFGVDSGNEVASVSQTITLPDDGPRHLNFFLRRGFVSAPQDATLEVSLGGTVMQTLTEPATAEAAYAVHSVDLSQRPRGLPLLLEFRYSNGGAGKSNFNLDDVSIDCAAASP